MRKRINNSTLSKNAVNWKYPLFFEATVNGTPLVSRMVNPERDTKQLGHAFGWGYHGVFPANLAVSILCDFFEIDDYAQLFSESGYGQATNKFYDEFIRENTMISWEITDEQLWGYMSNLVEDLEKEGLIHEEA
jgi:hypothetical protein